jgi:hypothetical protein
MGEVSGVKGGVSGKALYCGARERGGGVILNTARTSSFSAPNSKRESCTPWPTSPAGLPDAFREHEVPNLIESVW